MTDNPSRPYDAETCRMKIQEMVRHYETHTIPPLEEWQKGPITGTINAIYGSDDKGREDDKRHIVLGWLFRDPSQRLKSMSSKELSPAQWWALHKWLQVEKILLPDGKSRWLPCEFFKTESLFVLHAAIQKMHKDEGQMLMELGFEEVSNG